MQKKLLIRGMTCDACERTVKNTLLQVKGVDSASVSYVRGEAFIKGKSLPSDSQLDKALKQTGYSLGKEKQPWLFYAGLIAVLIVYFIVQRLYGTLSFDPTRYNLTFGLVVMYGLVSSLHCVGMCGGIALGSSVSIKSQNNNRIWLYQSGRLISYTLSGLILGALGSTLSISPIITDALLVIAGLWMIILALKMANILRFNLPEMPVLFKKGQTPFIVGLLNALMPCGSLQTMQILALTSSSPWLGAGMMALFAFLTAPALIMMQWVGVKLSVQKRTAMQLAAAVLVAVLGLQMLMRSPLITKAVTDISSSFVDKGEYAPMKDGAQVIHLRIEDGRYTLDYNRVKAGTPVRVSFSATQFLGCANPIEFDFLDVPVEIDVLKNPEPLEFTIEQSGAYIIHCWMDMTKITLYVE